MHVAPSKLAFSLVELSIVLVILGLLVGGVLAGKSMIRAAELRSVVTDYNAYNSAVLAFRDKYFALPGDMTNATLFWGIASGGCPLGARSGTQTCNGNGDGQITFSDVSGTTNYEQFTFWQQLANAGLISGTFTGVSSTPATDDVNHTAGINCPRSSITKAGWSTYWIGAQSGSSHHWDGNHNNYVSTGAKFSNRHYVSSAFTPEEVWNIDTKIDDGRPAFGRVVSIKGGSYIAPNCATTAVSSTAQYNLTLSSIECNISFVQTW